MATDAIREKTPDESGRPGRRDWRETLTAATEIAVIGFCVVAVSLLVIPIGAAAATGSHAVRRWILDRGTPPVSQLWPMFLRWLVPGALATAAVGLLGWLMAFNIGAISQGAVPGGTIAVVLAIGLTIWLAMGVVLILVGLGRHPERGWLGAVRWAVETSVAQPGRCAVVLAVAALAALLGIAIEATVPLMVGYGLFAAHVVCDRLLPEAR